MPINPDIPVDGETNWDVKLNAALSTIITEVNNQETDIAAKADISHNHDAAAITTGVLNPARLGSGTPDGTKVLKGDGAWTTLASSATLYGKATWWNMLPSPTIVGVGEPMQPDGGWKEDRNQHLCLSPIDVAIDGTITEVITAMLASPPAGTSHVGIWASGSNGRPTGTPLWTSAVSITGGSGTRTVTVTPAVSITTTTRRWVGFLNLSWTAGGEVKRGVIPSTPASWFGHYGTDGNLFGIGSPGFFPQTIVRTGTTTISTDLTSATYVNTGDRPWLGVRLEHP